MADFATRRSVTARKDHRCGECFRAVAPGETYERAAGVWEGDFWTLKSCAHCAALRVIIDKIDNGFYESMYGGIHAWVENATAHELVYYYSKITDVSLLSLLRWSLQFGRKWRDIHNTLHPIPTIEGTAP